jgi:hypothetical protein
MQVDLTEIDEPERPLLSVYSLIEERHLAPLAPHELSEADFVEFFRTPHASWHPSLPDYLGFAIQRLALRLSST